MLFWRQGNSFQGPIYRWLLQNKHEILAGTAVYEGTPVDETTELSQFYYVISVGAMTIRVTSPHYPPTENNGQLSLMQAKYAAITLLLGWWCIPWGPLFTIHALGITLRGGRKRTAASLLQLLEWGWDAPHDVSFGEHQKQLLDLTDAAAAEIRRCKSQGDFPLEIGVRVSPARRSADEVEITFDYPVSDGHDWIQEWQDLVLLIDKRHEAALAESRLDFKDGRFTVIRPEQVAD